MRRIKRMLLRLTALSVGLAAGSAFPPAQAATPAGGSSVQVWLTDVGSNQWVAKQKAVAFQTQQTTNPLTIKVDDTVKYQKITGFGAALTDSSAYLIDKLPTSGRNALMQKLFSPSAGIGLSMVRSPMGATDFTATGNYSYDDMPAGQTDPTLAHFSIKHDAAYIIPELKQALALNPGIKVTSTPWSPPGWMKTSGSMIGGTLLDTDYSALANYFVKYVQAYGKAGVPISYVTPQNEPLNAPTWPGTYLTPSQETKLVQEMGQAFAAEDLSTKILAWDHNWDVPSYPESVYNDPTTAKYAVGAGFHIYSGTPIYQTLAHNDYPSKQLYLTEATGGVWQADKQVAFHDALDTWMIDTTRNYANGAMLWNIALDPAMGPLNSDTNGIGECRGLVTIDPASGDVTYNPDYYALAQVTKFVKPGAHRIYSNTFGAGSVNDVAFQNPDGSKVLVAYNDSKAAKTISVADGTQSFNYTLNAGNAATFTYSGPTQSGSTPAAGDVGDPTHDFTFKSATGQQTITYDPQLLPIQNSVTTGSKLTTYSLPVGAAIRTPGTALNRSGWKVTSSSSRSGDPAADAVDGDLGTRWRTAIKMKSGDWFQVDLGSPTSFDQITLDNTAKNAFDSVFQYQVYVSDDGEHWGSAVANGNGALGRTTITLPPQKARYIRIVSTAPSFFFHWSIGEIKVYGTPGETGSIQAPTAVPHGLQLQNWTAPDGTNVSVVYNGTGRGQSFPISLDGTSTYTLPGGTSAMFTTKSLTSYATPDFGSMTPTTGIPGSEFTITGSHFGATQGLGTVYFGGTHADIASWSDTSISAYVPGGLPSGTYKVSVNGAGGQPAGGSTFTVNGLGTALSKTGWTAKASKVSPYATDVLANMIDNDTDTRYSSGAGQESGQWVEVDMGEAQTFDTIALDAGSSTGDYARGADVYVSSDGTDWKKVAAIGSDGQQIEAVTFATQTARYVKVVNTGSAGNWWSIAEFNVYAGGSATPVYGIPLSRAGWTATASNTSPWPNDVLPHMLDGDLTTRYTSGAGQESGQWVEVDMGKAENFDTLVMDAGNSVNDYARSADVYVSSDGSDWTKVASIASGQPVEAVTFATQTARYVKVVNTGSAGNWWSIGEFNVYAGPVSGTQLSRTDWTATASNTSPWPNDVLTHMLDGDIDTRYTSGAGQESGQWVEVDMGRAEKFDTVELDAGSSVDDYARSADVYVSSDGSDWTKVASIASGRPVEVASFATQTARYVKVVNTGSAGNWWSIAEFNAYA
ncbi:discoidin domain-containing protein [Streptomyces sp. NPDC002588]|uniref:discoidin domain-containing protein n=1 Tax=Streptomyces sp. NPDC002588 TaxID=3154419 RepID=UPI0033321D31